jgi:hypothetical protein
VGVGFWVVIGYVLVFTVCVCMVGTIFVYVFVTGFISGLDPPYCIIVRCFYLIVDFFANIFITCLP